MAECQMLDDFDINSFKAAVINTIVENNEIVYQLDENFVNSGGNLLNIRIFPFLQNPKTVETTDPFICFRVNHTSNANAYVENINVEIDVICHEKGMKKRVQSYKTGHFVSGTVIDIIAEEIKKSLVGLDTNWLGELRLVSNTESVLYYEYPCRVLTFEAKKESYANYR